MVGAAEPPTAAAAEPTPPALVAEAMQRLRQEERAVDQVAGGGAGSATDSVASPAVEMTLAVVEAVYSRATPGVNAPNVAGAPIVSDSVAGTVAPGPT